MVKLRTSLSGSVSDFGSLSSTSSEAASGLGRGVGPGVPVPVSISTDAVYQYTPVVCVEHTKAEEIRIHLYISFAH